MRTIDITPRLKWDRRLGLAPGTVESVVHRSDAWRQAQCGEIDLSSYWQAVGHQLGLTSDDLASLRHDFYSGDQLDQELVALIRDLRAAGVRIGLLTNNTLDLEDTLYNLSLNRLFDTWVISAQIGVMKPDPLAYRAILHALGVSPGQAILVDDFAANTEGARAVGMHAIHFSPDLDLRAVLYRWLGI